MHGISHAAAAQAAIFHPAKENFMPRLALRILAIVLGFAASCALGIAQESGIPPQLHPWGTFETGVWKLVHVTTQSLDEQGHVASSGATDTKTTLVEIDKNGVKLEVDACMEVAGKRFQAEPQIVEQGFHGEQAVPGVTVQPAVDGEIVVEDRKIPCKVQQFDVAGPNEKTHITVHYSTTVAPYVLKRESVTTDLDGKNVLSETKTEVIAFDMPVRVQLENRSGTYVKTVQKTPKETVTTLAVVLPDVPGGVVYHSMKEVDANGRVVRRSTLELVAYSTDPDNGRLLRKRPSRHAKTPY